MVLLSYPIVEMIIKQSNLKKNLQNHIKKCNCNHRPFLEKNKNNMKHHLLTFQFQLHLAKKKHKLNLENQNQLEKAKVKKVSNKVYLQLLNLINHK